MIRCMDARWLLAAVTIGLLVSGGCRKPGPPTSQPAGAAYDPETDPLVNPPSMFEPPPEDLSRIATDETLYITLRANPNTMNPLFVSSGYDFIVVDSLYKGLVTFDKDLQWRLNDDVVESLTESDDHTEFVFKIKPGLTWHDGMPWTAHDVVFSWQQILDPQVPCLAQKPSVEPITECVALDDYTVVMTLPQPFAPFLAFATVGILPDQKPRAGEGEFAPFFGRDALTFRGIDSL